MLPVGNMETVIFYTTFIPVGARYLHARTFFTLADSTSMLMGVMYFHARMFCTLAHHLLYPWVQYINTCKNVLQETLD